jgi:hypothetical protein
VAEVVSTGAGAALMAGGMAILGYTTYLAMIRAGVLHGFVRTVVLVPTAVAMLLSGLVLVVR